MSVQVEPLNVSPLSQLRAAAVVFAVTTAELFELYVLEAVTTTLYCVEAVKPLIVHGELVQLAVVVGEAVPYSTLYALAPGIAGHERTNDVCAAEVTVGAGVPKAYALLQLPGFGCLSVAESI